MIKKFYTYKPFPTMNKISIFIQENYPYVMKDNNIVIETRHTLQTIVYNCNCDKFVFLVKVREFSEPDASVETLEHLVNCIDKNYCHMIMLYSLNYNDSLQRIKQILDYFCFSKSEIEQYKWCD